MQIVKRKNDTYSGLLEDFFGKNFFDLPVHTKYENNVSTSPLVNIRENEDEYRIEVALPGINKKDVKLEINNNTLTVSYESQREEVKETYSRKEFSYQSFNRSFTLPENKVNTEKIKADYKDGILFITLPKREEAKPKPKRLIDIG